MLIWNGSGWRPFTAVGHPPHVAAPALVPECEKYNQQWYRALEDHIRLYEETIATAHRGSRQLDAPAQSKLRKWL